MKRIALSMAALGGLAFAQTMKAPDITKNPTLYVVPYAHLDTQWRWEFPQTISEYLLKTMRVNFDLMDKYPHYVFNWTGANRYRLMKEYFPSDYAKLKQYVAKGQWYPAGSSMEEGDVNLPNAEGIIRQILYGNTYFRKEFGKASAEYMLPDCFGFPASLPSILAHAGVKGFSTQKLSSGWQPAPRVGGPNSPEQTPEGIPFNVGIWTGTDGKSIIAALNPGGYGSNVTTDLRRSRRHLRRLVPTAAADAVVRPTGGNASISMANSPASLPTTNTLVPATSAAPPAKKPPNCLRPPLPKGWQSFRYPARDAADAADSPPLPRPRPDRPSRWAKVPCTSSKPRRIRCSSISSRK